MEMLLLPTLDMRLIVDIDGLLMLLEASRVSVDMFMKDVLLLLDTDGALLLLMDSLLSSMIFGLIDTFHDVLVAMCNVGPFFVLFDVNFLCISSQLIKSLINFKQLSSLVLFFAQHHNGILLG